MMTLPMRARKHLGPLCTCAIVLCWIGILLLEMHHLLEESETPCPAATPPTRWPIKSVIKPSNDTATLVFFAHPECPCTRASIEELARLLSHCGTQISAYALFYRPTSEGGEWDDTDLVQSADAIPGLHVLHDVDGAEASLFGALTSGQTMVYDRDGILVFSGGITASRGHAGDNLGQSAIQQWVLTHTLPARTSPVFGCAIVDRTMR